MYKNDKDLVADECIRVADDLSELLDKLSKLPDVYDYLAEEEMNELGDAHDILFDLNYYLKN